MAQYLLAYKLPMKTNPLPNEKQRANFSIKAETTIMLDNFNNWNYFDAKRLNASLILYYHPKFLEDIGFFLFNSIMVWIIIIFIFNIKSAQ